MRPNLRSVPLGSQGRNGVQAVAERLVFLRSPEESPEVGAQEPGRLFVIRSEFFHDRLPAGGLGDVNDLESQRKFFVVRFIIIGIHSLLKWLRAAEAARGLRF
jgi:hypothetical protein